MTTNVLITVRDGNVERALSNLKRGMMRSGTMLEMRRHEEYTKPSMKKRKKAQKARVRARRYAVRRQRSQAKWEMKRYGRPV